MAGRFHLGPSRVIAAKTGKGGGAPFDPTSISSLRMWLDPSDAGSRTLVGSGPWTVSGLTDKSGNGNNATSAGADPSLGVGTLNGLDCLVCGVGGSKWLNLPNFSSFTAAEAFIVCASDSMSENNGLWLLSSGGVTYHPFSDGKTYESFGRTAYVMSSVSVTNLTTPHTWNVSSTASAWVSRKNGSVITSAGAGTVAFHTFGWLGNNWTGLGYRGRIGELLLFNAELSAGDRTNVESYLQSKWAI